MWPIDKDYEIGGDFSSTEWNYFELLIDKCSASDCKTDDEINEVLKNTQVDIAVSNYYFDTNQYENPVKVSLDNRFSYNLIPGYEVGKIMNIRINEAEDWTNYYPSLNPEEYKYYSIDTVDDHLEVEDPNTRFVFKATFQLDRQYTKVERKVYTFVEVLGQIGGVIGIILPLGAYFVAIFSNKIYWATLINCFYLIETDNEEIELVIPEENWNTVRPANVRKMDTICNEKEESKISHHMMAYEDSPYENSARVSV